MNKKLLTLASATLMLAWTSVCTNAASSGTAGDKITWTLSDDSVLVVSGEGKMSDNVAWNKDSIKKVIISDGITYIGEKAFFQCKNMISADIANSVEDFGKLAFAESENLQTVTFPKSMKTIPHGAFSFCKKLANFTIPYGVERIEEDAFQHCYAPKNLEIPTTVTYIGENAFEACLGLTSVVIPNSVDTIEIGAFTFCMYMKDLELGSGLKFIGSNAFTAMSLTHVTCWATTPPVTSRYNNDVFDRRDVPNALLEVPQESVEAYKAASQWGKFGTISGIVHTGVGSVKADSGISAYAQGGTITVSGAEAGTQMQVYAMSGAMLYSGAVKPVAAPAPGIYVVRVAGKAVKVAVR